jgi:hypothetical protein
MMKKMGYLGTRRKFRASGERASSTEERGDSEPPQDPAHTNDIEEATRKPGPAAAAPKNNNLEDAAVSAANIVPAWLLKAAGLLFLGLGVALILGFVLSLDDARDDEKKEEKHKCEEHFEKVRAYGKRVHWQAQALGRELEMSQLAPFPDAATDARQYERMQFAKDSFGNREQGPRQKVEIIGFYYYFALSLSSDILLVIMGRTRTMPKI